MPFPTRLLNEGEEVAYDLRPHWWFFAQQGAVGVIVIAVLYGVLQLTDEVQTVGLWFFALAAVAWSLWMLWRLLVWFNTYFVVTSERLISRHGVLSKGGREIPLERVNDITFDQSLWERIIGAGDLLIESAGEQGQNRFTDIPEPESVQQEIYRRMQAKQARHAGAGAGRPVGEPTIPEQIAQLADLRDRGALSPEEFEQKKTELLGRM